MTLLILVVAIFFLFFFLTAGFLMLADVIMRDVYKALGIFQKKTPFPVVLLAAALATAAPASAQSLDRYEPVPDACVADREGFVQWVTRDPEYSTMTQDYVREMDTPTNPASVIFVAGAMIDRYVTWAQIPPATPRECIQITLQAIARDTYDALVRVFGGGR